MDYLNRSGLSQKVIKENIDKNILEELLSTLISSVLLDLEIKDLDLTLSEDEMVKRIKMNKEFLDENGKFKRTLYEKFLLKNNMTAAMYEMKLKSNVLQKQLFTYISSGAKSPDFFVEEYFTEKNSKLTVDFIDLNRFYKAKEKFSNEDLIKFINDNSDKLKQEHIDFSYIVISPKILTGSDEFDQTFFNKIDEIENQISKNVDFKSIANGLKITPWHPMISIDNNCDWTYPSQIKDTKSEDCPDNVFATLNPLDNYYAASTLSNGNTSQTTHAGNYQDAASIKFTMKTRENKESNAT